MQNPSYRVVLDTNIVIGAGSSWLDDGVPVPDWNLFRRVLIRVAESHTGLYCEKLMAEYSEKLLDRHHPTERAAKLITYLMGAFSFVTIISTSAPDLPTDPDDEVVLFCAIDGKADYLVSEDKHLTDLKGSYTKPVIGRSHELSGPLGA